MATKGSICCSVVFFLFIIALCTVFLVLTCCHYHSVNKGNTTLVMRAGQQTMFGSFKAYYDVQVKTDKDSVVDFYLPEINSMLNLATRSTDFTTEEDIAASEYSTLPFTLFLSNISNVEYDIKMDTAADVYVFNDDQYKAFQESRTTEPNLYNCTGSLECQGKFKNAGGSDYVLYFVIYNSNKNPVHCVENYTVYDLVYVLESEKKCSKSKCTLHNNGRCFVVADYDGPKKETTAEITIDKGLLMIVLICYSVVTALCLITIVILCIIRRKMPARRNGRKEEEESLVSGNGKTSINSRR